MRQFENLNSKMEQRPFEKRVNPQKLMSRKFCKRITSMICLFLLLSTKILGQDPLQPFYDAQKKIDEMAKQRSSSNTTSRSSSSSSNSNSNYYSAKDIQRQNREQRRQEQAKKIDAAIQSNQEMQKDNEKMLQQDEPKMQEVLNQKIQQAQLNNQKEFQQMKTSIDASFKKQEQMYKDALAYEPPQQHQFFSLSGDQLRDFDKKNNEELRDVGIDMTAKFATTYASLYAPEISPIVKMVVGYGSEVARGYNHGQSGKDVWWNKNAAISGAAGAATIKVSNSNEINTAQKMVVKYTESKLKGKTNKEAGVEAGFSGYDSASTQLLKAVVNPDK